MVIMKFLVCIKAEGCLKILYFKRDSINKHVR